MVSVGHWSESVQERQATGVQGLECLGWMPRPEDARLRIHSLQLSTPRAGGSAPCEGRRPAHGPLRGQGNKAPAKLLPAHHHSAAVEYSHAVIDTVE